VDPVTRSLILRAGGTRQPQSNTTLVDQDREVRESNAASFAGATMQLIDNFDVALTKFEADMRTGKANVRVAKRESTGARGGGGSFGPSALGVLMIVLAARRSRREELRLAQLCTGLHQTGMVRVDRVGEMSHGRLERLPSLDKIARTQQRAAEP